ncbi:SET and MYND domain-containing protein 4-like [Colletes gigas]|uniref:SET and MYND domain-containing protein 4-like n=1 Tax=Colletes gigas TaxID=935657 RepID=UPI001C9B1595|nr:SET and MYND domain-containing protein 4-like [Colletes gigas]XP_043261263.1 SET and MYND domain-containing protein 4-like [Colletes gigas]
MEKIVDTISKKILTANKYNDFFNEYKSLSTDEERIIFTLKIMSKYDIIPTVCGDVKNIKESEKLREQGNKVFVSIPLTSDSCLEALKLYTKSIAYAPYPSEQLALAYANRSAVLLVVHKYKECIQDIDRALALTYPNNLKAKLYIRKVECLKVLQHPNTENTIKEAQQWLEKMSLNDINCKKLNDKLICIKKMPKLCNSKIESDKKHKSESPFPEIKTRNTEIPCASDALTLKYNEQYGRHVVANRKINPGEVIAIEKPYSLIISPDNIHTHCSNCLEISWANIPCNYCTYSMYCSEECKASEWKKYHDLECSVFPSIWKMSFNKLDLFSVRFTIQNVRESINIQELKDEIKEIDSCDDPRTKGFSENGIFESSKYRSLLSLVTNTEKRSVQDLFRKSLDACFILYFLATCSNMFGGPLRKDLSALIENPDVTFIGSLILRHQQIIPSNMHSFSEMRGLDSAERGLAALPFFSLINHSCEPNILRHSRSKHAIMFAVYPIEKGEQIYDNYSYHFAIDPKATRQKELLRQYYFNCDCVPCREDWPLFYNVKLFSDLVKKKEDVVKITHALGKLTKYVNIATEGNILNKRCMINDLVKMIEVLYYSVPRPCQEMCSVVETLKHVYDLSGNSFEVPKL